MYDEFAITVRATSPNKDRQVYDLYHDFLAKSNKQCLLRSCVYERNKLQGTTGVHMHGIIRLPKSYYRKRLVPKNGSFHVCLKKITDLQGWINYMQKDEYFAGQVMLEVDNAQEEYIDIDDDPPIMVNLFKKKTSIV